ncbi:hypothetical protein PGT21_025960 [Puccinia graminis f. sp. tritici]|uniref:Uncharacterized protein n=1 Tax=Puccinia graminis f. sp. tritici TaxID=56615 RepID=A0A5B0RQV2_PUCGR|nr:hypothetical protein PGT21_025960 [Puccinia graminis f. sp. tritici]KAA1127054.1 hypothetical protein PGTUg99_014442 [Puccinia graminis f. sp. tritici]
MTLSGTPVLRLLGFITLLLQSRNNTVSGKVFRCDQSLAPVTQYQPKSTTANPLLSSVASGTRPSIMATPLSNPVQPFSINGPPPTKELACKSESGEKTFAFCVADSCIGTATCEGCRSDFGMMVKVKCMSYHIQNQQNFCEDINGIKFVCAGSCEDRTAKTKSFRPPWEREMSISPLLIARSKSSQNNPSAWIIATLSLAKLASCSPLFGL